MKASYHLPWQKLSTLIDHVLAKHSCLSARLFSLKRLPQLPPLLARPCPSDDSFDGEGVFELGHGFEFVAFRMLFDDPLRFHHVELIVVEQFGIYWVEKRFAFHLC